MPPLPVSKNWLFSTIRQGSRSMSAATSTMLLSNSTTPRLGSMSGVVRSTCPLKAGSVREMAVISLVLGRSKLGSNCVKSPSKRVSNSDRFRVVNPNSACASMAIAPPLPSKALAEILLFSKAAIISVLILIFPPFPGKLAVPAVVEI